MLVEGPVEVTLEDGTTVSSDRFCVALCTCRRSRIHPWCDTSHRRRAAADPRPHSAADPRPHSGDDPGADGDDDAGPHAGGDSRTDSRTDFRTAPRPHADVDGARRRAQPPD